MIDTAKLKEKILDLAIRGKLVPQDPNDEPASVLLERIRAEKLQMVKDGKLKQKDIKDDTIIFLGDDNLHYEKFSDGSVKCIEDEIPFEIPKSWAWCRVKSLSTIMTDYVANGSFASLRENVKTYKEKNYALFVRTVDFANDFKKDLMYIDKTSYEYLSKSKLFGGELMLSNIGASIGKVFRIPKLNIPMSLAPNSIILSFTSLEITDYIEYVFKSFVGQNFLQKLSGGAAMPKFNKTDLKEMIIPLPPLNEQVRIITTLSEYLNLLDFIDTNKEGLLLSINSLKSKILDLAIRGKLAPQDPNDEPADVLLERIRKEKEELIKQGKIKRDKKESIIFKGDDNSYYGNLPNNWSLTTLKEITNDKELNDGDWIVSDNMVDSGPVKLIQLGSIGFMNYIEKGFKYLTHDTFERLNCSTIKENYLLINRIISDKMCCCMLPKINGTLITTVDTCWIAPNDNHYNIKYLMFALSSPLFQSEVNYKSSGTTRRRISKFNLINIQFPFPPILEQKKIVDDVEKLFKFIDNIASALK